MKLRRAKQRTMNKKKRVKSNKEEELEKKIRVSTPKFRIKQERLKHIKELLVKNKEKLTPLIFLFLIAVFYGNTLFNGFVLDDIMVVRDNPYVQSLKYLPKVITGCIWEKALDGCKGKTLHYRPIHTLSYLLTYQISSQPLAFHLVNLIFFFIAANLVFQVAFALTKKFSIALLSAIFFLIHPINNEPVNWISAVSELTLAIFVLLTILYYIKYRQQKKRNYFYLTLVFFFLAMLSKEPALIVLPPMILAIDYLFFKKKISLIFSRQELKNYLFFLIPIIVYWLMRIAVLGGFGGLTASKDYLGGFSPSQRVYYFFWLFSRYLQKLIFPYPLIFLHELKEKTILLSGRFLLLTSIFLLFVSVLLLLIKRKKNFLAFTLVWIGVFISPLLVFYNIVGENIFAERYLFVPTIGLALFLAYWLDFLRQKNRKIKLLVIIIMVVVMVLTWLVIFPRNRVWKNNVIFFKTNLVLNPDAHPLREYLANEYLRLGDPESAKVEFEELIRRAPDWMYISHAYSNLGDYYRSKNESEKAEEYYKKAIETATKINSYKPHNNLGAFYMEKQDYLQALLEFCRAIQADNQAPEPQHNFNYVANIIQSTKEENLIFLYMNVTSGNPFKKSPDSKVKYSRQQCAYNACSYVFVPQLAEKEIILPFLIMAQAFPNELIKIDAVEYKPETNEIVLGIDPKYSDRSITFLFPSCTGVYYEAMASPVISPNP